MPQDCLARAIAARGLAVRHLPSGAGHDAMVFPALAPSAMLFVRCGNGGISHHPDETRARRMQDWPPGCCSMQAAARARRLRAERGALA
ncbi:MAG: M20/M25/M40 family metallo-hydrolase [Burkholderiaceae bacterium]|nr:M20/M25/M40 family metallo-hydrolase [Burkholderiaceae bacterium]